MEGSRVSGHQEAASFNGVHMNDPEWYSMKDLAFLPVMHWPSLPVYAEFKQYWFHSLELIKLGGMASSNDATLHSKPQANGRCEPCANEVRLGGCTL